MAYSIKLPGKYVQGAGELKNLGLNVKKLGNKFFILCTPNNRKRVGTAIEESLQSVEKEYVFCDFGGACTKAEIARVMEEYQASGCDAVVGVGGGTAVDTAKAVSENLGGLPLIIVPTVASNDAPCSGVAVIYNEEGVVIKSLMLRRNPDLVLVDTAVVAAAPKRLFAAGVGDALATWFETRACRASGAKNMAHGKCTNTAYMMSRLCYDLLMENGSEALRSVEAGESSEALENVVEAGILLSGVGFESGGLAVAHAVNDSLALLPQVHGMYHGEKVAFGLLVQLVLEGENPEELPRVLTFLKEMGLPVTLAELGITDPTDEDLRKVAEAAVSPKQFSKNLRADINADEMVAAIRRADEIGRA